MLELDPRIDRTKIKSVVNADDSLVGKTGYFTTKLNAFKDLSTCSFHGTITKIDFEFNTDDNIFIVKDDMGVVVSERYFIADEDLLPPAEEYRPFNSQEFVNKFDVGKVVCFRHKIRKEMDKVAYAPSVRALITSIEYYSDPTIRIGNCWYSLERLFEDYELWDAKLGWIPFGVKANG
jgi:hypothetical protein